MSFFFKAVLGQRVVHPPPPGKKQDAEAISTGVHDTDSSPPPKVKPASASLTANEPSDSRLTKKPNSNSAASLPVPTGLSENTRPPLAAPQTASPSPSLSSLRPSTPTRTLLLRIEGCTVAQDIRDAQRDLLRCPDLPYALDATSLKSLLNLLVSYPEDESITEPTLHLLANATDLDSYPDQLESNHRIVDFSADFKRHARDALLEPLVDAVPLLLDSMKPTAPFWNRYYVVVLLQRLEECEPYKVKEALLTARGISVLLDALNEVGHDHQLLKQALVLLTSLTLADAELQTLLAFDNAFDTLFDVIQREGGVRRGGSIVRECLTVVHNMLRSNKATQKLFREMGCAARLAALFDTVPSELKACTVSNACYNGAVRSATAPVSRQPIVLADRIETLLDDMEKSDTFLGVLMSVSILACVLRGGDEGEEGRHSAQESLLRCGLLNPLARLAFSGLAIDDATRIEAVRVLGLLLRGSKRVVDEWLDLPPLTTLVRVSLPYTVQEWSAPRALVSYICETTDTTLVSAGVQLFTALLSVPSSQERLVGVFLGGLATLTPGRDAVGSGHAVSQMSSTTSLPNTVTTTDPTASSTTDQCGAALARVLLSSRTSPVEKFYAAQVLRTLITLPDASHLVQTLVLSPVPPQLQASVLDGLVKAQPGWTLSTRMPPSFFNYMATFLIFCLNGGAAAQQVNTAALGAYVATLLAWMGSSSQAAASFLEEVTWGEALLHQARRDGAVHLRLWSAVIIASACVTSRTTVAAAATAHSVVAANALAQRFIQVVGGGTALETILFDAQASTLAWQHPVSSGLQTQNPTPYDAAFVAVVEQLVVDFKQLLTSVASSAVMEPSLTTHPTTNLPGVTVMGNGVAPQSASLQSLKSDRLVSMEPPSDPAIASLTSQVNNSISSGDYRVEPGLPQPLPAQSHMVAAPIMRDVQTHEELAALQAELEAARTEKAHLMKAVVEWRERAEEMAARCASLEKEQQHRHVAAAAEEERVRVEDAAASAAEAVHSHTVSTNMVESLRENIRLLEEALGSKEEEHQQLVESLNMMEEQLRCASNVTAASASKQKQPPSPDIVDAMAAERNAVAEQLALSREEKSRLERSLQCLSSDYNDLLLLVAELNEECVSVKALSSVAPTPGRPWHEDVEPAVRRETMEWKESAVSAVPMCKETLLVDAESRPAMAVVPERVQGDSFIDSLNTGTLEGQGQPQALSTQVLSSVLMAEEQTRVDAELITGVSHHTFEGATYATDGLSRVQAPAHGVAAPPPAQQLFLLPTAPGDALSDLNPSVSQTEAAPPAPLPLLLPNGQQHRGAHQLAPQPLPQTPALFPPPALGALPHHQHQCYQSVLQAPRYPDPFMTSFGEGGGGSAELPPRRDSVASADGRQPLHQASQLAPLTPPPRPQCAAFPEEPQPNPSPPVMDTDAELMAFTAHPSAGERPRTVSRSLQDAPTRDAASAAEHVATHHSAGVHPSAPQSAAAASPGSMAMSADAAVLNPFLASSGRYPDNTLASDGVCQTVHERDGVLEMGVGGVGGRNDAHWAAGGPSVVANTSAPPYSDAALNSSAPSANNRCPPSAPKAQSHEAEKNIGSSTATFNPFADFNNGTGDGTDDEFDNLR
ncbi:hypothetical protein JKF63_01245 [Porcisia hertigi]|uniref:Uncharacterized protein n=1 Tax=Porcisia hertigi TaxID=2761500 RepID=A0A836KZ93_9TRYP|nr:hypothetical protein JKF63_01245 [Porcisia hertigi]